MTKKVRFFDKRVREVYEKLISLITTISSLILIFVEIPDDYKICSGIVFVFILIFSYVGVWLRANTLTNIDLNIEGTTVHIVTGDIFEQKGLKVIPFNEYFDTQVDDRIISKRSLNGQYIEKIFPGSKGRCGSLLLWVVPQGAAVLFALRTGKHSLRVAS